MTSSYPIHFSAQLRQHLRSLRKKLGITQAQLGARIGVSQARIAEIEANPGLVSVDQMLQILSALDTTMCLTELANNLPQEDGVINNADQKQTEGIDVSSSATDKFEVKKMPQVDNSNSADATVSDAPQIESLTNEKLGLALASGTSSPQKQPTEEAGFLDPTIVKYNSFDSAGYAYRFNLSIHQDVAKWEGALGVANTVNDLHEKLSAQNSLSDQISAISQRNNLAQQFGTYDAFLRSQPSLSARDSLSQKLQPPKGMPVEGGNLKDYLAAINKNKKGSW